MIRRCDDTIKKKQVNSCVLRYPLASLFSRASVYMPALMRFAHRIRPASFTRARRRHRGVGRGASYPDAFFSSFAYHTYKLHIRPIPYHSAFILILSPVPFCLCLFHARARACAHTDSHCDGLRELLEAIVRLMRVWFGCGSMP